jgi:predicted SAM-dependent methyltransferase
MYMQFGCGWSAPSTWINFDASPTLRFERLPLIGALHTRNAQRFPKHVLHGDIVAGLPLAPNSCAGIYASHVLEHLSLADADTALGRTHHYLRSGGTFRLVVPDLRQLATRYLEEPSSSSAHQFMRDAGLGQERRSRGVFALARSFFGNSAHLWMWDEASMTDRLLQHGFCDVRRAQFGDSDDPRFAEVEEATRFDGCLAMQCKKQ